MADYTGILPLYKPRGMTSHDCISRLRGLLKYKKIGHTGTLDPAVDGVLPICFGRATKVAQYLTDLPKSYDGVIRLGSATTTEDQAGEVIEQMDLTESFTREKIETVFDQFIGGIVQIPPMYSAVKVNGKKLYEYARNGLTVERPAREVIIYDLTLNSVENRFEDIIPFMVNCSKGTYVRTLAVDIGKALGYPAHLEKLTRVRSGLFSLKNCYTFEMLQQKINEDSFASCLSDMSLALKHLKSLTVDDQTAKRVMNGAVLNLPKGFQNSIFTIYNKDGDCLAIYQQHPTKPELMKPDKVLVNKL
ncbi:tRNA pseudouridine synthase B [Scopulibacillus darangshiensis]|uniref:tRNA pseudouridine synthase B n=1 Tax=Scopulibacillus darangshiensis TaxID=442528 RepID=A0A4R2P5Z4_9BACL|nr:tRNA pseudouridine(55) synthase TruB [Scopulibacillus darangshiensis]TCP30289.1 tRNA pseudouridine synthase B [Scopulibacillus darangshiensis]